jgi:HD-GYP domain-containing protein (c-di-GMP phosphodiesterase class II)
VPSEEEQPAPPPSRAEIEAMANAIYTEALQAVGRFFSAGRKASSGAAEALPIADIETVAGKLVSGMLDEHVGDALVAIAVGTYPDEGRFIVPHSVNVAVLSQRVARQVGLEGQELITLAVAALVHDVGTVRIDKEIFYKEDSLTNEEWELMRQRPTFSAEIIAGIGPRYRAVAEIAHQVHERLDGNGYPRGLTIESIALEASILGAVDIFEAFIHPRPYKKTVPAAAMYGVDNLMRMSHQFGDGVLKSLVRSVGLFPVGTYVRLNSGEIGRVLRGRSANPMRPEVEVVLDTQKRRLSQPRYIDLMSAPHLYVFKPMSPEELAEFSL